MIHLIPIIRSSKARVKNKSETDRINLTRLSSIEHLLALHPLAAIMNPRIFSWPRIIDGGHPTSREVCRPVLPHWVRGCE